MTPREVQGGASLRGRLRVPGDKSISHRSLILNAMASGTARITGLLESADVHATERCLRACGVQIERDGDGLTVTGSGGQLAEPEVVLDCGNSGTTIRLLTGLFSSQQGHYVLTGDASLRSRPMGRVVNPLRAMGARITGRRDGALAPLAIHGGDIDGGTVHVPVASAQVKTALLLAALGSGSAIEVHIAPCRDHTERMLRSMGVRVLEPTIGVVQLESGLSPQAVDVAVPGDISSAAFWAVAGSIIAGSDIAIDSVGLNPSRTGVIDVLQRMGADITVRNERSEAGEPVADLRVRTAELRSVHINGREIPRLIDELPVLAVAAACAVGRTVVSDAAELRVKESDRIAATVGFLRSFGAQAGETEDGFWVEGPCRLQGARVNAVGDHRIAMASAVAALAASGTSIIDGAEAVDVSYPTFFETLDALTTHP